MLIESLRGGTVESRHRVSAAVVDRAGRLLASAGDSRLVTFMRSSAKPFQALPLVQDGVVERFAITPEELALACASHNSERRHVEVARGWLERIGCAESDLACGPHEPLVPEYAIPNDSPGRTPDLAPPSPLASNCSGKHTGMLALARHHGWPTAGYHLSGHPVQQRVKRELARWSGIAEGDLAEGIDGCDVVTFALPLDAIATAFARLVTSDDPAARMVVGVMCTHPFMVAGTGRLCTALMDAYAGAVVAKMGAAGLYGAALVNRGLGIALKVEDGHGRSAMVALLAVLERLGLEPPPSACLPGAMELPITNTRNRVVGTVRAVGELAFG
jgi:L-asparaginase II